MLYHQRHRSMLEHILDFVCRAPAFPKVRTLITRSIPPNWATYDISSDDNPPGIGAVFTVHCIFSRSILPHRCTSGSISGRLNVETMTLYAHLRVRKLPAQNAPHPPQPLSSYSYWPRTVSRVTMMGSCSSRILHLPSCTWVE